MLVEAGMWTAPVVLVGPDGQPGSSTGPPKHPAQAALDEQSSVEHVHMVRSRVSADYSRATGADEWLGRAADSRGRHPSDRSLTFEFQ
jgi:hypothetical protein